MRREHARCPLDFFLGYLYPQQVEVAAVIELQNMGIPCVNFFCDNVREFYRLPREYRAFALHWVPEFEALALYRRAGAPHIHAPMPCWVSPEFRHVPATESEPPTFVGSADMLRRALLGAALRAGSDFVVRGPGWQIGERISIEAPPARRAGRALQNQMSMIRQHGLASLYYKFENRLYPPRIHEAPASRIRPAVFGTEYIRVTREAQVTIGVNRVPTARTSFRRPLSYSRLRDLEGPMLGACYLTERTNGLGQLYELGTEIEAYGTPEELALKLSELKSDPARRRKLRERGQKRALEEHSVARTLNKICAKLGLP